MGSFIISYRKTAKIEGGYVNDPTDKGGRTYCGISQVMHPGWPGWTKIMVWIVAHGEPSKGHIFNDISGLDDDKLAFYKAQEWDELRLDEVAAQDWCDNLYDTAVNHGTETALHFVQDSLKIPHTKHMDDFTLQTINQN